MWVPQSCLTTVFNLGQCHRKRRRWALAVRCFEAALSLDSENGATHGALAFTHHLSGRLDAAVEGYHKALALRPEDTFCAEMLTRALSEAFETTPAPGISKSSDWHLPPPPKSMSGGFGFDFLRQGSPPGHVEGLPPDQAGTIPGCAASGEGATESPPDFRGKFDVDGGEGTLQDDESYDLDAGGSIESAEMSVE